MSALQHAMLVLFKTYIAASQLPPLQIPSKEVKTGLGSVDGDKRRLHPGVDKALCVPDNLFTA